MSDTFGEPVGSVKRLPDMTVITPAPELPTVTHQPAPRKTWQGMKATVTAHKHTYIHRIGIPDRYRDGTRYILARKCDCGDTKAYDLVNQLPGRT